jgi:hypothetical protein
MIASLSTSRMSMPRGISSGRTRPCASSERTRHAASGSRDRARLQKRSGPVRGPSGSRGVACGAVGAPWAAPSPSDVRAGSTVADVFCTRLVGFTGQATECRPSGWALAVENWSYESARLSVDHARRALRGPAVPLVNPEFSMHRRRRALLACASLSIAAAAACRGQHAVPTPMPAPPQATAPTAEPAASAIEAVPADAGAYSGPWLSAVVLQTQVLSDTDFPTDKKGEKIVRLGYLRYGEKTPAAPVDQKKPNCPEGWYSLLAGGFVCGRYATVDLEHPKIKTAPALDLDGPLPYAYGVNLQNGTPLYRQIPSHALRRKLEPWLFRPPPRKAKVLDDDNPYGPPTPAVGESAGPDGEAAPADVPGETPWWEREAPDGGPLQITLEDLQESGGPISRRMVKGFYLSLDKQFDAQGAH